MPDLLPPDALHVLIVDDEPLIQWALSEMLAGSGIAATVAPDGATALGRIVSAVPKVDVVLLDYHLPDAQGMDVLDALRRAAPEAVIVVMTGHVTPGLITAAQAHGAFRVVDKPIDPDALTLLVREAKASSAGSLPTP